MVPTLLSSYRSTLLAAGVVAGVALSASAALPTPNPDNGGISLPPGFRAVVFADNVTRPNDAGRRDALRFLTVAPNGDVYVKSSQRGIYALRDADGDGRADLIENFGRGNGSGVAIRDGWLYYSTNSSVHRYKLTPGELVPKGDPETIVKDLPDERSHSTKAFAFDDQGRLVVEVGSPYNVYSKPDRQLGAKGMDATEFLETHGGHWRFDANKTNQTLKDGERISTGIRHSLSIAWHPGSKQFFIAMMGRDNLNTVAPDYYDALDNAERVAEEFHALKPGINLGWPYTYWDPIKNARMVAPEFGGDNRKRDDNPKYAKPLIAFPAHWAPMQLCVYQGEQFPAKYRGGMFLAFRGSWNRAPRPQSGYRLAFIPFDAKGQPTGEFETFADDFPARETFTSANDARYRPSGVAVGPDGSLYVSETQAGRIWRIFYTGETTPAAKPAAPAATEAAFTPVEADSPGGKIYATVCAACHMPNGSGVANMQPPLVGNPIVAGDSATLINVILKGPAAVLPAEREKYQNVMPPFAAVYSDAQVADVVNYIRANFAPNAPRVTPAEVARERAKN